MLESKDPWIESEAVVMLPDGATKRLRDINCGEKVCTLKDNGLWEEGVVTAVRFYCADIPEFIEVKLSKQKKLVMTYTQEVMTSSGWRKAWQLNVGDFVRAISYEGYEQIKSIKVMRRKRQWANLELTTESYIANGMKIKAAVDEI